MRNLTSFKPFISALLFYLPLVSVQTFAQNEMSGMASADGEKPQPQSGDAPKDARDPHAYSAGTTLTKGPYALGEEHRLSLIHI